MFDVSCQFAAWKTDVAQPSKQSTASDTFFLMCLLHVELTVCSLFFRVCLQGQCIVCFDG